MVDPSNDRFENLQFGKTPPMQAKPRQVRTGEGASYLLLSGDGELVAGDQVGDLLHAEVQELFTPDHLGEMLLCSVAKEMRNGIISIQSSPARPVVRTCVDVGLREELGAGVQVRKGPYSKTVGWVKLGAQEFATGFFHLVQLEQACCGQQRLSHIHTHTFFFFLS